METDSIVRSSVSVVRKREGRKQTLDDILYLIMGDASISSALILLFTIIFFGTVPVVMIILFANYSGGMRWLVTLGIVTVLGFLAIFLMNRGLRRKRTYDEKGEVKTEFEGQLTEVTDAVERGSVGYVYSQQLLRERLCDDIVNKLALSRDMSEEEIINLLEADNYDIVGDKILAEFLEKNRRGTKDGYKDPVGKGKSSERGQKFMIEIEVILDRIEEII
ncbi:MAG: hypothetical protein KAJ33_05840 [Thermoplasmata archaeon]|nr:hypothetical protein [Thermoplasmata archaeon]